MNIPKNKIEKQGRVSKRGAKESARAISAKKSVDKRRTAFFAADDPIVEIINIKIDPEKIIELKKRRGFYDAYHMSKKNWITIALDGSVSDGLIFDLLKESHALVSPRPCRARS